MVDGMAWLATMPVSVERQRRLLELLLDAIARDPTYRWLELGCSLARGVGDEWSDIDAGVGVGGARGGRRPYGRPRAHPRTGDGSGPTALGRRSRLAGDARLHPVRPRAATVPGRDAGGRETGSAAGRGRVRHWTYLAWIALGDLAKDLERGSTWEAHARLEEARGLVWRLWAITQDLPYPAFGPTSVLDADSPRLPEGIDATAADVAEPPPMSAWVRRRPGAP